MEVGQGEMVALIGANGAGKTTFLRVVSGLLRPRRGTVRFESLDIAAWAPERIVGVGIAHVCQGRRLFSDLTVRQNLLVGAYARQDRENVARDLDHMVSLFPSLGHRLSLPASQLSGGEQQMLALAPLLVRELMEVVARLRGEGVSVLLVEQDVAVALGHAYRGYVLETGPIVLADAAQALLANAAVQRAYLGVGAGTDHPAGSAGRIVDAQPCDHSR